MAYLVKAVGYLSAGQWFETHAGQLFWIFLCVYFLIFFSSLEMISKKTVLYLWKAKMEKKIGHVKNRTYDLWLWYPMLYHWANQVQHITIVQASFISLGCEVRGSIFFMVLIRISPWNPRLTLSKVFSSHSDHFQKVK